MANRWINWINDVYMGIYFYGSKYEASEVALQNTNIRAMAAFFLYYFSVILILSKMYTVYFGPYKKNVFQFLIFLVLYILIFNLIIKNYVHPISIVSNLSSEEIDKRIFLCKQVFVIGIAFFILTISIGELLKY